MWVHCVCWVLVQSSSAHWRVQAVLSKPPTWVHSKDVYWCSLQPEASLKLVAEHNQLHSNRQQQRESVSLVSARWPLVLSKPLQLQALQLCMHSRCLFLPAVVLQAPSMLPLTVHPAHPAQLSTGKHTLA
jgi:hypothetical protein